MSKKIITILTAVMLACSVLTACGSSQGDNSTSESTTTTAAATEKAENTTTTTFEAEESKPDTDSISEQEDREAAALSTLTEGVEPLTWEPSPENLIIKSDEARELYTRIKAEDYPTLDELKNSEVIGQIDALSAYYTVLYGNTAAIDTPERQQLREDIKQEFLAIGSARTESVDEETGRHKYVYDGEFSKDYKMELVLGLPASGKSSRVVDPDSEEMKAFILDCDVIKELIPEFQESYGAGADAVHMESMDIMDSAVQEFLSGEMKGTNVILPLVADDLDNLTKNYIKPFEEAGYTVTAKFVECEPNVSVARNLMRELETGRIINSGVVMSFGTKPLEVYKELAEMKNTAGEPYGLTELTEDTEEEIKEAA